MRRSFNATTIIVLIALLWSAPHPVSAQRRRPMPDTPGLAEPIDLEAEQIEESDADQPTIEKPAAAVPAQQDSSSSGAIDPNQTEINVKNADIAAVVRIFSKKTKRNYILDERVKGKVSIYLPGKVSAEESLKILDSVLALKGFSPVPLGENLWKIVPSKEAKQSTIPTIKGDGQSSRSNAVVTRILNLKYIAAEEAREVIAQLVSPDGLVSAYGGTNSLLMIDYEDNVSRLVDILNTVDVPFSNREMTIIPIKNADAPDIQKKLAEVLGIGEQSGKGDSGAGGAAQGSDLLRARLNTNSQGGVIPPNEGGAPATGGTQAPAGGAVSSKTLEPKIIADERTNSILVVADDETTARIRALISQLDSEQDLSGYRFYVYKCQHAKADELAQTLAGLMGGQSSGGGGGQTTGSNLLDMGSEDGSMRTRGTQFNRTQDRIGSQQRTPGRSRTETQPQPQAPTSVQFGKNMSITADRSTNTLIINAGKAEYEKIKSLLQQLDIKRRQVLVESMLLEVRADDTADYGFDWLTSGGGADGGVAVKNDFGTSQNSLTTLFSNPSAISGFSVAAASKGSLKLPGGIVIPTQSVLLTAAQSNSNINILSAPNILTTDNEEAQIVVGQNVPFISGRSTDLQNINNQFNQIERQDVGITLRLTPQISSESFVNLKLFTEVSSIASQSPELGPTTSIRTSETSIIAKDGQMVVIGGLMADAKNDSDSGVPFLKDIPVLGWAFKSSNTQTQKTNLLIFITPRILQDQYDARDVSKERSGDMADELEKQKSLPDRSNVLRSDKMDKVTDIRDFDGTKPTTILPPTESASNAQTGTAPAAASVTKEFTTDSPGVIQLKVAPKFPKALTSSLSNKGPEAPQKRVVLFKAQKVEGMERLPFSPNPSSGVFGIEVPSGSSTQALQFFTDHQQFRYESGDQSFDLTQVGTYADRQTATSAQQGSLTFYTLSPFEVMNLGKKLWMKR
jgi:general secretion pathway protein D